MIFLLFLFTFYILKLFIFHFLFFPHLICFIHSLIFLFSRSIIILILCLKKGQAITACLFFFAQKCLYIIRSNQTPVHILLRDFRSSCIYPYLKSFSYKYSATFSYSLLVSFLFNSGICFAL